MKTVIRIAGGDFERAEPEAGAHKDDIWEGELPLVPGRLPDFKVSVTTLDDDNPPRPFLVSPVCLVVCGDWSP